MIGQGDCGLEHKLLYNFDTYASPGRSAESGLKKYTGGETLRFPDAYVCLLALLLCCVVVVFVLSFDFFCDEVAFDLVLVDFAS